jgi:V/A-type H+-transporting ATPase subunit K
MKRVNFGASVVAGLVVAGLLLAVQVSPAQQAAAEAQGEQVAGQSPYQVRCWAFIAAALATGLGSLAAGLAVSGVGTAAMGAIAEKPELTGKSLIYVALAEGIAIYGLLISIIILAKV